jgi:hypothetical protein
MMFVTGSAEGDTRLGLLWIGMVFAVFALYWVICRVGARCRRR